MDESPDFIDPLVNVAPCRCRECRAELGVFEDIRDSINLYELNAEEAVEVTYIRWRQLQFFGPPPIVQMMPTRFQLALERIIERRETFQEPIW